jgi:prevent-host-death family protein
MRQIQASVAKARFAELLGEVERGESVVITRHGKPVAWLIPDEARREREIKQAMADIEEIRKHTKPMSVEEILAARDEGRK